ncbi:hypothetical protein R2103_13010 [Nitrosomonas sp. Is24]|uniref:hypothetical protein n=1 Tax=Nitrosomonas sp. Is24 TaxID=3080533 RepID=UPI00294B43DC|nr:hypothetical protein [Nitrosomonas sp. Is24]MDV6342689.1 hypothetical protein [Nitrosomonas sp. Is24]
MKFIHIKDLRDKSGGKRDEMRGARNSATGIYRHSAHVINEAGLNVSKDCITLRA